METNEVLFERYRHCVNHGHKLVEKQRRYIWFEARDAAAALVYRNKSVLTKLSPRERCEFIDGVTVRFLQFIVAHDHKTIGWCFSSFKRRFSCVLTTIECETLGVGLTESSHRTYNTHELKVLTKTFKDLRKRGDQAMKGKLEAVLWGMLNPVPGKDVQRILNTLEEH